MTSVFCKSIALSCAGLLALSACGGGTTTASVTPTPLASGQSYEMLASNTAATTSDIGGGALISNGGTGAQFVTGTTGTLAHGQDQLSLNHSGYSFTSQGGFNPAGNTSDGQGASLQANTALGTGYSYLMVYTGTYTSGANTFNTTGVAGIVTAAADMPSGPLAGTAIYNGSASLTANTQNNLTEIYSNGNATMTASFGSGTADLTLDNFSVTNATGTTINGSFTGVTVNNMAITGNTFSGGTVGFNNNGAVVTPTGPNTTGTTQGAFFGFDQNIGAPDEVGGVLLVSGDTGEVVGVFVAD